MKQFVVIGLGNFGFSVATRLAQIGHEVLAIDSDEARIESIKDRVTQAVVGDARDDLLLLLGVRNDGRPALRGFAAGARG